MTTTPPDRAACKACGGMALASTLQANGGLCMACVRSQADQALGQLHDTLSQQHAILHVSNPAALPRNKNSAYRQSVLTLSLGVACAFDELKLSKLSLLDRYHANPEHFYVADADLTPVGQQFVQARFRTWLGKQDRWKPESRTVETFKASLAKEFKSFQQRSTRMHERSG